MSDEKDKEGIKVVDRRRFDPDGTVRAKENDEVNDEISPNKKDSPDLKSKDSNSSKETSTGEQGLPVMDFSGFIMSFATQALMQLGEIKPPPGVKIDEDVVTAKQTIDILTMLDDKTKGNLDAYEKRLLEEILHNLRLTFVKISSKEKN